MKHITAWSLIGLGVIAELAGVCQLSMIMLVGAVLALTGLAIEYYV